NELAQKFRRAMESAREIFGNVAFRKRLDKGAPRHPINKTLFEAWSVNLALLDDSQLKTAIERKTTIHEQFIELMSDWEFEQSVTQGTGSSKRVKLRFRRIQNLLQEVIT
ncbi:MAG: hypothetical protein ACR2PY_09275, partial [Salinispira sp.]